MAVGRALIDYQEQVQAAKFHLSIAGQKLSITRAGHKIQMLTQMWTS